MKQLNGSLNVKEALDSDQSNGWNSLTMSSKFYF